MKRRSIFRSRAQHVVIDPVTGARTEEPIGPARRRGFFRSWYSTARPFEDRAAIGATPRAGYDLRTDPGEGRSFLFDVVIPGTAAGIVGGLLMLAIYAPFSALSGEGAGMLLRAIGSVAWPFNNLEQLGVGAGLLGLVLHFGVSISLAVAFAMMIPRRTIPGVSFFPLALIFSMVVYVVMNFFIAEWAADVFRREIFHPLWFIAHLVWAASLGLIQPLRLRSPAYDGYRPSLFRRYSPKREAAIRERTFDDVVI